MQCFHSRAQNILAYITYPEAQKKLHNMKAQRKKKSKSNKKFWIPLFISKRQSENNKSWIMKSGVNMYKENKIKKKTTFEQRTSERVLYNLYAVFLFLNVGCRSNIQQKKAWRESKNCYKKNSFSLPILSQWIRWCSLCVYEWIYYYSCQNQAFSQKLSSVESHITTTNR